MSKAVSSITIQGDVLTIHYTDSDDLVIDEKAAIIKWKKHPKIVKLMQGFFEIIGTYFLTENKSLGTLEDEQIEELLRRLVQDEPPTNPGC